MIFSNSSSSHFRTRYRGISLLDILVSIPLVGIAIVAALNTVGASKASQYKVNKTRQGHLLAQDLLSEIMQQDFADSNSGLLSFGQEAMEIGSLNRSQFNDVDDYDGWQASPPQYKDGTVMSGLPDWQRIVEVSWRSTADLQQISATATPIKHIRVNVLYKGIAVADLEAFKTIGLPPLEACCFSGGLCENLRNEACVAQGGTALGTGTYCANSACPTGPKVLLVVVDDTALTAQELAQKALIESWDNSVMLISASAMQFEFDEAISDADVAYITVGITANNLGTKLTSATIGVVNSQPSLLDDLKYSSGTAYYYDLSVGEVTDNTHPITSTFTNGSLTLSTTNQWFVENWTGLASGAQVLAVLTLSSRASLFVFERGASLVGGIPSPARRVELPWGHADFDFSTLTADAQTIMKNAIEWAAEEMVVCGDGTCAVGEACSCVADCGLPALSEISGSTCDDGIDNDCNNLTDCQDLSCYLDPACAAVCGNNICDNGEDCNSCAADCSGKTSGPPSGRYCCGNGIAESAEGDGSICDGNY